METDVYDDWPTEDLDEFEAPPDAETANKYLRWYRKAVQEAEEISDAFALEIATLQARCFDLMSGPRRRSDQLRGLLTDYAVAVREATGKATVNLPHGTLATRAGTDKLDVDDATVIEWLDKSGVDLPIIRRVVTVSKQDVKTLLQSGALAATSDGGVVVAETGEVVPGVRLVGSPVTVTVKLDAPRGDTQP